MMSILGRVILMTLLAIFTTVAIMAFDHCGQSDYIDHSGHHDNCDCCGHSGIFVTAVIAL